MMAMDASERELERAQQQAMEMLFQQYIDDMSLVHAPRDSGVVAGSVAPSTGGDMASVMELLAHTCEDASDKLQQLSPEDVATQLMDAVRATQQSLRSVRQNVSELLADPARMQALQQHLQATDEKLRLLHAQHTAAIADRESSHCVAEDESTMALISSSSGEEDALRHAMEFAEHMCGVLDVALSTISNDEYELAAQLSLGIAQRMLEAGQALFLSLGEEERREQLGDRADRITIEEVVDDDADHEKTNAKRRSRRPHKRRQQAAVLRTQLEKALFATRDRAKEHPYLAAAVGAAAMPFVGLAVPMASVVGLALAMEKYYPEHTTLTLEMMSNFMQMMKLWLLLLKISARQLGHVAKQCLASWHEHAAKHGYVATGMELASTGCSLGWLCVSRLYSATMAYAARSLT
ncbi:hypothetical protein PINS_up013154 [Pythium insidiosum]|nr:hypothetical protein PINS_up013154 [Pythium insidiosum]